MKPELSMVWLGLMSALEDYEHAVRDRNQARLQMAAHVSVAPQVLTMLHEEEDPVTDEDLANNPQTRSFRHLVEINSGIALISVNGPLTNDPDWRFNSWVGHVGYHELVAAARYLAEREDIKVVAQVVSSPGGAEDGMHGAIDAVQELRAAKPLYTYAPDVMASAAYGLGAQASEVYLGKRAEAGSVGVIGKVMNRAEQLKKDGIEVMVVRSVPDKQRLSGLEKFTEEDRAYVEALVQKKHERFVERIAEGRGLTTEFVDAAIADGKMYEAPEAVDRRIADGILSWEEFLEKLVANVNNTSHNRVSDRNTGMARKVKLSAKAQAALAAGASAEEVARLSAEETGPSADTGHSPGVGENAEASDGQDIDTDQSPGDGEGVEASDPVPAGEPAPAEPAPSNDLVTYLRGEIDSARKQILDLSAANTKMSDAVERLQGMVTAMTEPLVEATRRLQVAIGATPTAQADQDPESLVSIYRSTNKAFMERFKVGASTRVDDDGEASRVSPPGAQDQARVKAAGSTPFKSMRK